MSCNKECYFNSVCTKHIDVGYSTKIIGLLSFAIGAISVVVSEGKLNQNISKEKLKYLIRRIDYILYELKKAEKCVENKEELL